MDAEVLQQHGDVMVSGLVNDSRKVNEGDMFIAYQGLTTHGLLYASDVAKKGAAVVLWDDDCDNCLDIKNVQQLDADTDGVGDLCDDKPHCGGVNCGGDPWPACETTCSE